MLTAERTALNLLGRLSGVATLTRRFVDAIDGTGAEILDTRKTTPGLRALEKYAVRCGGGANHRFGLDDGILVKDNHLRAAGGVGPRSSSFAEPERACRSRSRPRRWTTCARRSPPARSRSCSTTCRRPMREAVQLVAGQASLEASGGVSLETVREIAETGVDFVSVGALTHSARSLDVSLELE